MTRLFFLLKKHASVFHKITKPRAGGAYVYFVDFSMEFWNSFIMDCSRMVKILRSEEKTLIGSSFLATG